MDVAHSVVAVLTLLHWSTNSIIYTISFSWTIIIRVSTGSHHHANSSPHATSTVLCQLSHSVYSCASNRFLQQLYEEARSHVHVCCRPHQPQHTTAPDPSVHCHNSYRHTAKRPDKTMAATMRSAGVLAVPREEAAGRGARLPRGRQLGQAAQVLGPGALGARTRLGIGYACGGCVLRFQCHIRAPHFLVLHIRADSHVGTAVKATQQLQRCRAGAALVGAVCWGAPEMRSESTWNACATSCTAPPSWLLRCAALACSSSGVRACCRGSTDTISELCQADVWYHFCTLWRRRP